MSRAKDMTDAVLRGADPREAIQGSPPRTEPLQERFDNAARLMRLSARELTSLADKMQRGSHAEIKAAGKVFFERLEQSLKGLLVFQTKKAVRQAGEAFAREASSLDLTEGRSNNGG